MIMDVMVITAVFLSTGNQEEMRRRKRGKKEEEEGVLKVSE